MARVGKRNRRAYLAVAAVIRERFNPSSVFDVGCGPCAIVNYLKRDGVSEVVGIDGSMASKEFARDDVEWHYWDARDDAWKPGRKFDVVVCTEFAEHVPQSCEQHLINTLAAVTGMWLLFAACPPTPQKRTRRKKRQHVNEQPKAYWIDRIPLRLDSEETVVVKHRLVELGCNKQHYIDNLLIFRQ